MDLSKKAYQINILNSLGFIPNVSNLSIERRDKCYLNFDFKIDSKLKEQKINTIFNSKIIDFLNVRIIISLNENLTKFLKKNPYYIFFGCNDLIEYKNSQDYVNILRKINSKALNSTKIVNKDLETQISSVFKQSIQLNDLKLNHLTVFISIFIDNLKLNKNLKTDKIIGNYSVEEFINNFNYKNSKINDISIFKNKEKFNFNSLSFKESFLEKIIKIKLDSISKLNNLNYFSELILNINENLNFNGIFVFNIEEILKNETKFSGFFNNEEYRSSFFSKEENYLPENIKIIRTRLADNFFDNILEQKFEKEIDTTKCNLSIINVKSEKNKKISLSFLDKESSLLKEKYQYTIELIFPDKTIEYLNNILELSYKEYKNIQEIINIANSYDCYNLTLNLFDERFFSRLKENNLSIENCIKNISSILSKFKEIEKTEIEALSALILSRKYNFEVLDAINDIISFLKSELTRIKNYTISSNSGKIKIIKKFPDIIDFSIKNNNILSIINSKNTLTHPSLSLDKFKEISDQQILKYYNTTNIETNKKYSFLTPDKIKIKDKELRQSSQIDLINQNDYNNLLIDLYMNKIYEGNYSSFSNYEKLKTILNYYSMYESKINLNSKDLLLKPTNISTRYSFKEEISKEYFKLLFNIFIYCIVLKDLQINNYDVLDKRTNESNINKINKQSIPIQAKYIIESKEDNSLSRTNNEFIKKTEEEPEKLFSSYINTKKIYQLQYLDTEDLSWKELDNEKIDKINNEEVIVRAETYTNNDLNIKNNDSLNFKEINKVFTIKQEDLKTNNSIIDKNITISKSDTTNVDKNITISKADTTNVDKNTTKSKSDTTNIDKNTTKSKSDTTNIDKNTTKSIDSKAIRK